MLLVKANKEKELFSISRGVELVGTSHKVYVVKRGKVKVEILLKDLEAVSIATRGTEFVLHVRNNEDLRLSSEERLRVVEYLLQAQKRSIKTFFIA